ncbi:hypothetical protein GM173_00330 [Deefgea chitinilytica]|uniref:Transposase DDE domain-containing protein n=1 Tax=Deefgea chitinilytica TaxID=570276 RepID=A0ABS2C791_9NEIS|nr:hypothetical protein [Deefgea chitinilytica]MBM9887249.1 transposase [Deefgea sp. CFH1-16]
MIWLDPTLKWTAEPSGKRGRNPTFSDAAIQFCLTITMLPRIAAPVQRGSVGCLQSIATTQSKWWENGGNIIDENE